LSSFAARSDGRNQPYLLRLWGGGLRLRELREGEEDDDEKDLEREGERERERECEPEEREEEGDEEREEEAETEPEGERRPRPGFAIVAERKPSINPSSSKPS